MIKYFPFPPSFDLKMGTSAMKSEDTSVEIDEHYFSEITLKRSLLLKDHDYYFNILHGSDIASWDALEKVMDDLVRLDPVNFSLDKKRDPQWHWANKLLAEELTFTFGEQDSLPFSPLDWIGRQVQEDLLILDSRSHLVAGQLCFPQRLVSG